MYYIGKIRSLEDISWISTYRLIFNSLCSHSICIDILCQAYVFLLYVDKDWRLIYNDHIQIKDMFVSYFLCLYQKSIWTRFYLPCHHIVKRSSRVVGDTRLRVLSALQQEAESKANEKCASLYPVEGSPYLMFSCSRGMNGGTQGRWIVLAEWDWYLHQALASRDASSLDAKNGSGTIALISSKGPDLCHPGDQWLVEMPPLLVLAPPIQNLTDPLQNAPDALKGVTPAFLPLSASPSLQPPVRLCDGRGQRRTPFLCWLRYRCSPLGDEHRSCSTGP